MRYRPQGLTTRRGGEVRPFVGRPTGCCLARRFPEQGPRAPAEISDRHQLPPLSDALVEHSLNQFLGGFRARHLRQTVDCRYLVAHAGLLSAIVPTVALDAHAGLNWFGRTVSGVPVWKNLGLNRGPKFWVNVVRPPGLATLVGIPRPPSMKGTCATPGRATMTETEHLSAVSMGFLGDCEIGLLK